MLQLRQIHLTEDGAPLMCYSYVRSIWLKMGPLFYVTVTSDPSDWRWGPSYMLQLRQIHLTEDGGPLVCWKLRQIHLVVWGCDVRLYPVYPHLQDWLCLPECDSSCSVLTRRVKWFFLYIKYTEFLLALFCPVSPCQSIAKFTAYWYRLCMVLWYFFLRELRSRIFLVSGSFL